MTKPSLSALYRRNRGDDPVWDADRLVDVLRGAGDSQANRHDDLALLAASPLNAKLMRVAAALGPDAAALSSGVQQLRQPTVARRVRPAWMALAASLTAAALLVSLRSSPDAVPSAPVASMPGESISNLSFETAPSVAAKKADDAPIFVADFDT